MMRILQKIVELERVRSGNPSLFTKIHIWLQYLYIKHFLIKEIVNAPEYKDSVITLLRDFGQLVTMCRMAKYGNIKNIKQYMPILKYDNLERHASDDHLFLNHTIGYFTIVLTRLDAHKVYFLSFNTDEDIIDVVEYFFYNKDDMIKYLDSGIIPKAHRVSHYDMPGNTRNDHYAIAVQRILYELVSVLQKEGIIDYGK